MVLAGTEVPGEVRGGGGGGEGDVAVISWLAFTGILPDKVSISGNRISQSGSVILLDRY